MSRIDQKEVTSNLIHDKIAETYGYDISSLSSRLKYELAVKYLRPDFCVLDVGCANGIYMQALASYCSGIVGVDINDNMLALAHAKLNEKRIGNATLSKQSAAALNFKDETFDLVYSFSTLLLVPDTIKALHEISRVLKQGGVAIIDITGRYNLSQCYWTKYYQAHGHFGLNSFAYSELLGLLKSIGLEVLESHALGFTDQWKYLPLIGKLTFIDKFFHRDNKLDLDYKISNISIFFPLANRWYLVCKKAKWPAA